MSTWIAKAVPDGTLLLGGSRVILAVLDHVAMPERMGWKV
jgi:hypothetical protein